MRSRFEGLRTAVMVFAALYWKRANKYGAIATVLAVAGLWLAFLPQVLSKGEFLLFEESLGGIMPVTAIFVTASIVMVVVIFIFVIIRGR